MQEVKCTRLFIEYMNDYASMSVDELICRLETADRVIAEQAHMIRANEALIVNYVDQFNRMAAEHQRASQAHRAQIDGLTARYQGEPTQTRGARPVSAARPRSPSPPVQDAVVQGQSRRALVSSIAFGEEPCERKVVSSVRQSVNVSRNAMCDSFNEPAPQPQVDGYEVASEPIDVSAYVVDTTGMSVDEMRATVDALNIKRAELERQMNRVLPKGKVMSHLIREREEVEKQFEQVSKTISAIKLEIRQVSRQ